MTEKTGLSPYIQAMMWVNGILLFIYAALALSMAETLMYTLVFLFSGGFHVSVLGFGSLFLFVSGQKKSGKIWLYTGIGVLVLGLILLKSLLPLLESKAGSFGI